MTFINEYVSDEDVKKYKLQEMWDEYHPYSKGRVKPYFRHTWTIDREKNIFFIPARTGREEFSNQTVCILWMEGVELSVTIRKSGWANIKEGKGSVSWDLDRIRKPENCAIKDKEIIQVLKEALVVYGYRGILRSLPDYTVDFKF